jgi:hypothetical protein
MKPILALAAALSLAHAGTALAIVSEADDEKTQASKTEDASAVIYPCSIKGRVLNSETGAPIADAEIKLLSGTESRSKLSSSAGTYRFDLTEGKYRYIVTHPGYVMESGGDDPITLRKPFTRRIPLGGGFYKEVVVTSQSHLTIDIYMEPRPRKLLLVTTSLLRKTRDFDATVDAYIDVLDRTDGIAARYIEIDSADCRERYGMRASEPTDWEEVRSVLEAIVTREGSSYILLLGGTAVVPRPEVLVITDRYVGWLKTDAWYVDFNEDQIVDAGLVVSRLPEVGTDSAGVVAALETAIDRHEAGGYRMDDTARFSVHCWYSPPIGLGAACHEDDAVCGTCYATPPYGVCEECAMHDEFFDVLSTKSFIDFRGHGNRSGFYNNDEEPIFTIEYMDRVDLLTHQPLIMGYVSCLTGVLREDSATLSTEFLRAGAAAFVARTTTEGTPSHFVQYFETYLRGTHLRNRYRIGDAMFELMRESLLRSGEQFVPDTLQLVLYGDPTLRRSWLDTVMLSESYKPIER